MGSLCYHGAIQRKGCGAVSIGQRIAQKRKELGLSQEALGEQMGISRQAIYKWESDSALPEIDKLVVLSKLFDVSVGWLLGVEEQETFEKSDSDTMHPEQLDMVEAIVKRYMDALPKPKPRRRWPWVLAACVIGMVFIQLFGQIDQLSSQYNNLQNSVSNISHSVNSQINSITGRVEEILKAQNQLTAEYHSQIVSTDYQSNTVTIAMSAVPKTYAQGMDAVFVVDCGNGPREFESTFTNNTTFTCEAEVELTDSISVYVVFISFDGTRQTQVLDTYTQLLSDSYASVHIDDNVLMWKKFAEGKLDFQNLYVEVWGSSPGKGGAVITDCRLGIFHNQKLLGWAEACDKPAGYNGDYSNAQFFRLPQLTVTDVKAGDVFAVAALVTDSYGRQYMVCDIPYEVKIDEENGTGELTWVSEVSYDSDPAKWIFE